MRALDLAHLSGRSDADQKLAAGVPDAALGPSSCNRLI